MAITYDARADLKAFAERYTIDYPLLADEGSRVIRELGILDEDLEAHHARFGVPTRAEQHGVAYPMTFVLDESGRVEQKIVEEHYRSRYGGSWLHVELTIAPGWHVYGPAVPPGYTGLRIEAQSDPLGVTLGIPRWPETKPLRLCLPPSVLRDFGRLHQSRREGRLERALTTCFAEATARNKTISLVGRARASRWPRAASARSEPSSGTRILRKPVGA